MSGENGNDDRRGKKPRPGFRQDGKPYKQGNMREDGSYLHGKYRAPEHGKFQVGDGRKRGKREKGSKNLATIWNKQLNRKLTIGGETKSAAEWLVDALIRRGISRSDRAAETALERAEQLDRASERRAKAPDDEIIAAYFAQRLADLGMLPSDSSGDDQPENDDG